MWLPVPLLRFQWMALALTESTEWFRWDERRVHGFGREKWWEEDLERRDRGCVGATHIVFLFEILKH